MTGPSDVPHDGPEFPPARGVRVPWEALPVPVRRAVEARLGSPVVRSESKPEGFSPAFAGVVTDAAGHRTFLKIVAPPPTEPNPDAPEFYRQEIRALRRLPPGLPIPKFLWSVDEKEWVALAFEVIDGHTPALPWRSDDLGRVLRAWKALSEALTPAPEGFPKLAEHWEELLQGWRTVQRRSRQDRLDAWGREHLSELAEVESGWAEATRGESLIHGDLRADNLLLTDDRVVFVDWPGASVGAPWVDLVCLLPSVAMQGGPPPWELWGSIPGTERVSGRDLKAMLTAFAGFMVARSMEPPPPGLPTLRAFQRAQATPALAWLRRIW